MLLTIEKIKAEALQVEQLFFKIPKRRGYKNDLFDQKVESFFRASNGILSASSNKRLKSTILYLSNTSLILCGFCDEKRYGNLFFEDDIGKNFYEYFR